MNDSVFPDIENERDGRFEKSSPFNGLTKRELFAAFAMAGELASQGEEIGEYTPSVKNATSLAGKCVLFADKLIEVLNDPRN